MLAHGSIEELRRMARLPAKIRLTMSGKTEPVSTWLSPGETWRQVNGHIVEIDAAPDRKIELLRRAMDAGASIEDVDVTPPTLDDIYAHFLQMQGPGR
jgi:Cu-processing system ATP-binding protein